MWYVNAPRGYHTLGNMTSNVFKPAGLSLTYTNRRVRATTSNVLANAGVSSLGIMSVACHRNEKSIQIYVDAASVSRRRKYRETHQLVALGVVSQVSMKNRTPPSSAFTSSVAVSDVSNSTMFSSGFIFGFRFMWLGRENYTSKCTLFLKVKKRRQFVRKFIMILSDFKFLFLTNLRNIFTTLTEKKINKVLLICYTAIINLNVYKSILKSFYFV